MTPPRFRRLLAGAALAASALVIAGAPATASAAAPDGHGWVRLAHLSPDTAHVDVRLAPVSGDGDVVRIADVAYGAVSKYLPLDDGTWAVSMRPAGSAADAPAVVQASVEVTDGSAATVAVFGRNAGLTTRVVQDDLTPAKSGQARVRLVQASTSRSPVSVASSDGTEVARDAAPTTVSGYAAVPAGTWRLTTDQGTSTDRSSVTLKDGQVVSLFVLDRAHDGPVVKAVVDSSSVGATPKGYLATGGGYLAHRGADAERLLAGGACLLVLGTGAAGIVAIRHRARRA